MHCSKILEMRHLLRRIGAWASAVFCAIFLVNAPAAAQTVNQYTNTTSGSIIDSTNCTTTVTRTFSVGTSYTVSDVNLGVLLSHTYRGDLRISLTSPLGTTVQLFANSGAAADNLNVLFDDEASAAISTHTTDDTVGAVPPYLRTFIPANPLSAFDGQNAQGTWTMVICDSAASDTGTFTRADLYLTQAGNYADLSLAKTISNAAPASGANVNYTLTVNNASGSTQTATGITVRDNLPLGVTFVSAAGSGSYSSGTGIWTVGTLAPGANASITITVNVNAGAGAMVVNYAEIASSSQPDIDSTANNNSTNEDDNASVSLSVSGTRVAGTPPTLSCPIGTTVFDWDSVAWTAGSTSNNYAQTNIGTIQFSITNPSAWLNNVIYGGQSPARQNVVTGGHFPAQYSLFQLADFNTSSENAVTTITLPTPVPGLQFTVFDVDYNAAQFSDRITVTGTYNGVNVTPTLTNGISNWVLGNSAYGDAISADTSSNGNVVVTFSSPVDTVVIYYGNHSTAPAAPGQQAIALHDITFCNPQANLIASKTSSVVSDGVNATNPKAVPGAVMRYCLLVTNPGSGTATSVSMSDAIPANLTYVPGSMLSGTNCANAATAEDDNNSGADETDPFGASISGSTISAAASSITASNSFALTFRATVN